MISLAGKIFSKFLDKRGILRPVAVKITDDQIEGRTGPCAAGPLGRSVGAWRRAMSSTGTSVRRSSA